jgi:hypothetical protein
MYLDQSLKIENLIRAKVNLFHLMAKRLELFRQYWLNLEAHTEREFAYAL